jgi:hypothetical protein
VEHYFEQVGEHHGLVPGPIRWMRQRDFVVVHRKDTDRLCDQLTPGPVCPSEHNQAL